MNNDSCLHFVSLRRALKICSYAFLVVSLLRIPWVMVSVGRASTVFEDLMGGVPLPDVLVFANMFRNSLLLFVPVLLLVLGVAAVVTVRSKGGLFLYVNCGLGLLLSVFASSFAFAAQEAMRLPLEKLFQ